MRHSLPSKLCLFLVGMTTLLSCSHQPIYRSATKETLPGPLLLENSKKDWPDLKKKIWIAKFKDRSHPPEVLADFDVSLLMENKLREAFSSKDLPFLLPTEDEANILQGLNNTELSPQDLQRELAATNVSAFLVGNITRVELSHPQGEAGFLESSVVNLTLGVEYELYDVQSGRRVAKGSDTEIFSETHRKIFGSSLKISDVDSRIEEMGKSLSNKVRFKLVPFSGKIAWSGRVLRIDGGRIYLNAGKRTGLVLGDVLKVVEAPHEITDLKTGTSVGWAPGRMKGTVKVVQFFDSDGAVAVVQSGGGLTPDDRVELY